MLPRAFPAADCTASAHKAAVFTRHVSYQTPYTQLRNMPTHQGCTRAVGSTTHRRMGLGKNFPLPRGSSTACYPSKHAIVTHADRKEPDSDRRIPKSRKTRELMKSQEPLWAAQLRRTAVLRLCGTAVGTAGDCYRGRFPPQTARNRCTKQQYAPATPADLNSPRMTFRHCKSSMRPVDKISTELH